MCPLIRGFMGRIHGSLIPEYDSRILRGAGVSDSRCVYFVAYGSLSGKRRKTRDRERETRGMLDSWRVLGSDRDGRGMDKRKIRGIVESCCVLEGDSDDSEPI